MLSLTLDQLKPYIAKGLITARRHPSFPLTIYNYSKQCQYSRSWDEVTINCRGLILDDSGKIIARPFPKFFNDSELPELGISLPNLPYELYDKMDGSLGISYFYEGKWYVSTRGSMDSEMAHVGCWMLNGVYKESIPKMEVGKTYLWEIIYPENRIVVDYKGKRELCLLAIIDNETGNEYDLVDIGFPIVHKYPMLPIEQIKQLFDGKAGHETEGVVVRFSNGFRCKMKSQTYCELHKLMSGLSANSIFEYWDTGTIEDLIKKMPEEFTPEIRSKVALLEVEYKRLYDLHYEVFKTLDLGKEIKFISFDINKLVKADPTLNSGILFNFVRGNLSYIPTYIKKGMNAVKLLDPAEEID